MPKRSAGRRSPSRARFERAFDPDAADFGKRKRGPKRRSASTRGSRKGGKSKSAEFQRGFRAALAGAGYLQPPDDSYEGNAGYPGEDHRRGDPELRGRARRIGVRY